MQLHWNNIEEIVQNLEEYYSEEDIPENDLEYLQEMITSLPDFDDFETEVEQEQLKIILENWIELRNNKN